jgi:hypothetical protein
MTAPLTLTQMLSASSPDWTVIDWFLGENRRRKRSLRLR